MNKPLVSVVIPLFNKEEYVEKTLLSLYAQDYSNIEVIVIDDSSTDNSLNIANDFLRKNSKRFSRIVIETQENMGQAAARNTGIQKSYGDFVAFLDADDVWLHQKISRQVKYLEENPHFSLTFCNYFIIPSNRFMTKGVRFVPVNQKIEKWLLTSGYGGALESTVLARRSSIISEGGFNSMLQMCGGLDLAFRFKSKGKIGCLDQYLCGYRITADGWHKRKDDLITSYLVMLKNESLYGNFLKDVRSNLQIYLDLWRFRSDKSLKNLSLVLQRIIVSPLRTSKYLIAITLRVFVSHLRGVFYWVTVLKLFKAMWK